MTIDQLKKLFKLEDNRLYFLTKDQKWREVTDQGSVSIYQDGKSKTISVPRTIWILTNNKPLSKGEVIFHVDGNTSNNDPKNLKVIKKSELQNQNKKNENKKVAQLIQKLKAENRQLKAELDTVRSELKNLRHRLATKPRKA